MKILVLTNFSPAVHHALMYAMGLGKALSAELMLFHAYVLPADMEGAFYPNQRLARLQEEQVSVKCVNYL